MYPCNQHKNREFHGRRDFLKITTAGLLGAGLAPRLLPAQEQKLAMARSAMAAVYEVRSSNLFKSENDLDEKALDAMTGKTMMLLTGAPTPDKAWKELFSPKDIVSIKVNALSGRALTTQPALAYSVARGLMSAGVPENNILIWDRDDAALTGSGYKINRGTEGVRCFGNVPEGEKLSNPSFYDEQWTEIDGARVRFCKLFSSGCTAMINLPLLKSHMGTGQIGFSGGLKNQMGCINMRDTDEKFGKLPENFHNNPNRIASLNAAKLIREKTRLTILDAIKPQHNLGPWAAPEYVWPHGSVLVSNDFIALDAAGLKILNEKRDTPLPNSYLPEAERLGLGTAREFEVKSVEV